MNRSVLTMGLLILVATLMIEANASGLAFRLDGEFSVPKNAGEMIELGKKYENGIGTDKDYETAMMFYRSALARGHKDAQLRIDILEAKLENVAKATVKLAKMYEMGQGTSKNLKKAMLLYKKAVEQGYRKALSNVYSLRKKIKAIHTSIVKVGEIYEKDPANLRNLKIAMMYYKRAAIQGYPDIEDKIDSLKEQMKWLDEEEISEPEINVRDEIQQSKVKTPARRKPSKRNRIDAGRHDFKPGFSAQEQAEIFEEDMQLDRMIGRASVTNGF